MAYRASVSTSGQPTALPSLLVVEDDPGLRETICLLLEQEGYRVGSAATLGQARHAVANAPPTCIVLDMMLDGEWGGDLLSELAPRPTAPAVVVLSASREAEAVARSFHVGFVGKPFDLQRLVHEIAAAIDNQLRPLDDAKRRHA